MKITANLVSKMRSMVKVNLATLLLGGFIALSGCASVDAESIETSQIQTANAQPIRNTNVTNAAETNTGPHLNSIVSQRDFAQTVTKAAAGINERGFKTFAIIDHANGARSIGQDLRPTTLIIFGNPAGGTPLMQSAQTMGIELPLKMLVHEDEAGVTHISWPKMDHVFAEHGVTDRDAILTKIQGALAAIANEASANEAGDK